MHFLLLFIELPLTPAKK